MTRLSLSEAKERGNYLEDCVEEVLKKLQREKLVLKFDHYESKFELPDLWATLSDSTFVDIECKNWDPTTARREESIRSKFDKHWRPGAKRVLVLATYSKTITDPAKKLLTDTLGSLYMVVLGWQVLSKDNRKAIEDLTGPLRSMFIQIIKASANTKRESSGTWTFFGRNQSAGAWYPDNSKSGSGGRNSALHFSLSQVKPLSFRHFSDPFA